jgi:predicted CXXCH cytochrome family protein
MIKRTFHAILLITMTALLAQPFLVKRAEANIFGSPHDLFRQGYIHASPRDMKSNPQCQVCHIRAADDRPQIWKVIPDSLTEYGDVGILCSTCHDGVSMMDRNVDAGLTVFHPESHGLDPSQAPEGTDMVNTGLPYVTGDPLSCNTCHDPHSQVRRPFLRVPVLGLCSRCHQGRRHSGFAGDNESGNHPVSVEPFDNTENASPIDLQDDFATPYPKQYPLENAIMSTNGHWQLGGHLSFGHYGRIECSTCHAFHGLERTGPVDDLLAKEPVKKVSNEFCEGCHRGQRGDNKKEPPFPNPGGTVEGRTYHPVDNDEANGEGWNVAIADTVDRSYQEWGAVNPIEEKQYILCTTCHSAHDTIENSPALKRIGDEVLGDGVTTFCETCHREPPEGHHGYANDGTIPPDIAQQISNNLDNLGQTYGDTAINEIYCSYCHRAHNAGYERREADFIPILVDKGKALCSICHELGVSHFMGDPTLPSTYDLSSPSIKRDPWPSGASSYYEGEGEFPMEVTCLSCHNLSSSGDHQVYSSYLLAPADENSEWAPGYAEDYLCTGCHSENPSTEGSGHSHPTMDADSRSYPFIYTGHLQSDEVEATYTDNGAINCHSCHRTHNAVIRGGVYILKVVEGNNTDPKAIRPSIDFTTLCHSCHPASDY